jgi:peptide/nickel transport system permease protein
VDVPASLPPRTFWPSRLRGAAGRSVRYLAGDWAVSLALLALGLLVFLAIFGPLIWRSSSSAIDLLSSQSPPSLHHLMGTDDAGRDVLVRFNEGARISLTVGVVVVAVGALIGGTLGVLAGATGGWLDSGLMRAMDSVLAFPPLILAMAVSLGLGAGVVSAAIGIVLTSIPYYARLVRSDVLRVRSLPFVEAARALGAGRTRLMARHIVPHVTSTLLIQAAANFGYTILTLAALGFVGLGAQTPTPEWGAMITEGQQYILTGQWWIGVFPGLGVLVAVTAASVLADRLRDVLDPRGRYTNV